MAHKYIKEELGARKDIRKSGFPVILIQEIRSGGTQSRPEFSKTETTVYALDISTDPKYNQRSGESQFRKDGNAVKFEKAFMVSTENISDGVYLRVGDDIRVEPTLSFLGINSQEYKIVYILEEAPAGVALFYICLLDGSDVYSGVDDDIYAKE